jgi:hypothetical protein
MISHIIFQIEVLITSGHVSLLSVAEIKAPVLGCHKMEINTGFKFLGNKLKF